MTDETRVPPGEQAASLWGRRLIAVCLDWAIASAISAGFFDFHSLVTLGLFALERVLLTATLGSSFGQRVVGLGVRRLDGRVPSILQAVLRTAALCLIVPVGVTSREDGRGLHDVWAGTRLIRLGQPATA